MSESAQTRFRQNDGIELAVVQFLNAGFDIASVFRHLQIRANVQQLSLSARAACSNLRPGRQHVKRHRLQSFGTSDGDMSRQDQRVGDRGTFRNSGQLQSRGRVGWEVFQTMNSEVGFAAQYGILNFFREDSLPSHRRQSRRAISIADR